MEFKISPSFGPEKLVNASIETKIEIYEDRIRGWIIRPARELLKTREGEHAALGISLSYFEGHQIFRTGQDSNGRSSEFFQGGFKAVFWHNEAGPGGKDIALPADFLDLVASRLYGLGRCGIYHTGFARAGIFLAKASAPISSSIEKATGRISAIFIDVGRFLADIEAELGVYLAHVRNPAEMDSRGNFEKAWAITNPDGPIYIPSAPP